MALVDHLDHPILDEVTTIHAEDAAALMNLDLHMANGSRRGFRRGQFRGSFGFQVVVLTPSALATPQGARLRALIAVRWRGGLRVQETLETDPDPRCGSLLVRLGKRCSPTGGRDGRLGL